MGRGITANSSVNSNTNADAEDEAVMAAVAVLVGAARLIIISAIKQEAERHPLSPFLLLLPAFPPIDERVWRECVCTGEETQD